MKGKHTPYTDKIVSVRKSGHGHYAVTFSHYDYYFTASIDDMTLIDAYRDEDATEADSKRLYFAAKRKVLS
tara:strand:- start:52 stop:264 length:213 start_codon:yes stop_codon:yes gene_type:complete